MQCYALLPILHRFSTCWLIVRLPNDGMCEGAMIQPKRRQLGDIDLGKRHGRRSCRRALTRATKHYAVLFWNPRSRTAIIHAAETGRINLSIASPARDNVFPIGCAAAAKNQGVACGHLPITNPPSSQPPLVTSRRDPLSTAFSHRHGMH